MFFLGERRMSFLPVSSRPGHSPLKSCYSQEALLRLSSYVHLAVYLPW